MRYEVSSMIKQIVIDFSGAKNEGDVILVLSKALGLPEAKNPGWDGFSDYLRSLGNDSEIVRIMNPLPEALHLVLKNLQRVRALDAKMYSTLCEILIESTEMRHRTDGIQLIYSVVNE